VAYRWALGRIRLRVKTRIGGVGGVQSLPRYRRILTRRFPTRRLGLRSSNSPVCKEKEKNECGGQSRPSRRGGYRSVDNLGLATAKCDDRWGGGRVTLDTFTHPLPRMQLAQRAPAEGLFNSGVLLRFLLYFAWLLLLVITLLQGWFLRTIQVIT